MEKLLIFVSLYQILKIIFCTEITHSMKIGEFLNDRLFEITKFDTYKEFVSCQLYERAEFDNIVQLVECNFSVY